MTRIVPVLGVLCAEWTTAEEGTVIGKMISVLLPERNEEIVGGKGEKEENVDVVVDGVVFMTVGILKTPMAFLMRNLWRLLRVYRIHKDKLINIMETKGMLVYILHNKSKTVNFLDMLETLDHLQDIREKLDHFQDNQDKFKNILDTKEKLDHL